MRKHSSALKSTILQKVTVKSLASFAFLVRLVSMCRHTGAEKKRTRLCTQVGLCHRDIIRPWHLCVAAGEDTTVHVSTSTHGDMKEVKADIWYMYIIRLNGMWSHLTCSILSTVFVLTSSTCRGFKWGWNMFVKVEAAVTVFYPIVGFSFFWLTVTEQWSQEIKSRFE